MGRVIVSMVSFFVNKGKKLSSGDEGAKDAPQSVSHADVAHTMHLLHQISLAGTCACTYIHANNTADKIKIYMYLMQQQYDYVILCVHLHTIYITYKDAMFMYMHHTCNIYIESKYILYAYKDAMFMYVHVRVE